jgi:hypothetical protein
MTTKFFTLIVIILLPAMKAEAQDVSADLRDLSFYADAMIHASVPAHRMRAAGEFYRLFKSYLGTPAGASDAMKDLPWLTVVAPPDSLFRVITWQVQETENFRYYGFIQDMKDPDHSFVELTDTRPLNSESALYDQASWYGAIYYGLQPFRTDEKEEAYLMLGFNAHTNTQNQRVADILRINDSGISLGLPVFVLNDSSEIKSRIILEYSDAASATMRFDREKELLIYDHVIPINTPEGPALVPDGSYHGFRYRKGMWHFVDSVFNVIVKDPPGGKAPEKEKRDLFGREVKKKD